MSHVAQLEARHQRQEFARRLANALGMNQVTAFLERDDPLDAPGGRDQVDRCQELDVAREAPELQRVRPPARSPYSFMVEPQRPS
jgi:hypothetical protein